MNGHEETRTGHESIERTAEVYGHLAENDARRPGCEMHGCSTAAVGIGDIDGDEYWLCDKHRYPIPPACRYPCDCEQFPEEHCACMDGHTRVTPPASTVD